MKTIKKKYKEPILFNLVSRSRASGYCTGNGSYESAGSCLGSGVTADGSCSSNGGHATDSDCVTSGSVAVGNCAAEGGSAAT